MSQASVGFHCPECLKTGRQQVHTASSILGQRPPVTMGLLIINVVVFVVDFASRSSPGSALTVTRDFALRGDFVDVQNEWYRMVTSGFLHANLMHIGFNMFLLYQLGRQLERWLGRVDYIVLYAAGLLGGAFGVLLLSPRALTVGASGAVFGLMGGWLMHARSRGVGFMDSGIGTMVLLNLVLTFAIPNISVGGHLGGLLGGVVVGWILTVGERYWPNRQVEVGLAAAVTIAFGIAGLFAATTWTAPLFDFF